MEDKWLVEEMSVSITCLPMRLGSCSIFLNFYYGMHVAPNMADPDQSQQELK